MKNFLVSYVHFNCHRKVCISMNLLTSQFFACFFFVEKYPSISPLNAILSFENKCIALSWHCKCVTEAKSARKKQNRANPTKRIDNPKKSHINRNTQANDASSTKPVAIVGIVATTCCNSAINNRFNRNWI